MSGDRHEQSSRRTRSEEERRRQRSDAALGRISDFLHQVGHSSLFDYYGVSRTAPPEEAERAINERRRWAQSQQSNAKFRAEARWLIRNHALVRLVMLERREAYLRQLKQRRMAKNLELLGVFIRGTFASGELTAEAEAAIRQHARSMGIPDTLTQQRIDDLMRKHDVKRAAPPGASTPRTRARSTAAQALLDCIRDVVARGHFSTSEVEKLVQEGRSRDMSDEAIRKTIEMAAARRARQLRSEDGNPSTLGPRSGATTLNHLDEQLRAEAIREIIDTVRGSLMMGVLSASRLRAVQRRGIRMGLDHRTVEMLVAEAKKVAEDSLDGSLDAYGVLGVSPDADQDSLRQAYQEQRRWAQSLPDMSEGARASVKIDGAWALVKDPRSRERYDAKRASAGAADAEPAEAP